MGRGTNRLTVRFGNMPKFYFHLHNDIDVPDEEGLELADLEAARDYASCNARAMMGEVLKEEGRIALHHSIDIEDGQGRVLATVRFADVVQVES